MLYHLLFSTIEAMRLPPQLLKAMDEDRCIFFFGAGVSQAAGLPSAYDLAKILEDELRTDISTDDKLLNKLSDIEKSAGRLDEMAQLYNDYYKGRRAYATVASRIAQCETTARTDFLRSLMDLPTIRDILTTNYDCL